PQRAVVPQVRKVPTPDPIARCRQLEVVRIGQADESHHVKLARLQAPLTPRKRESWLMKRVVALAFVAAACAVPAANAAAPKGPTLAQFKALQAQLKKDEKRIKDLENLSGGILGVMLCQNAITADAL